MSGTEWTPYGAALPYNQGCSGDPYQGTTLNRGAFIVAYTLDGTPIEGVPECTWHGIGELVRSETSVRHGVDKCPCTSCQLSLFSNRVYIALKTGLSLSGMVGWLEEQEEEEVEER